VDATRLPRGRLSVFARLDFYRRGRENRMRVKSRPWDKRGRARMSRRKGSPDGKFYRRTSV
jgi:hypothetical protein